MPEKDFIHLFTKESRIEDVLKRPQVKALFLDKNPEAGKK